MTLLVNFFTVASVGMIFVFIIACSSVGIGNVSDFAKRATLLSLCFLIARAIS